MIANDHVLPSVMGRGKAKPNYFRSKLLRLLRLCSLRSLICLPAFVLQLLRGPFSKHGFAHVPMEILPKTLQLMEDS